MALILLNVELCWATFEKLPLIGYYICLLRQLWNYLYAYSSMIKWMIRKEILRPHIDLILKNCSNFDGRTAVLTGGTRGIGAQITKKLLQVNANIIIGCRDIKDGEKLMNSLRRQGIKTGSAIFLPLDLTSLASVRRFAEEIIARKTPVDLLINNAGIMGVPFKETSDGLESHFQVNFLSHFLLINLLLPLMVQTASSSHQIGRIVNVNAALMYYARLNFNDLQLKKCYNPFIAYFNVKMLQVLMTRHVDALLKNAGVNNIRINSVHPGVVATDLVSHMKGINLMRWIMEKILMTPDQGADCVLYVGLSPVSEKESGEFFVHMNMCTKPNPYFTSRIQKKVWEDACELSGFQPTLDFKEEMKDAN